jgi:hypothetical protein
MRPLLTLSTCAPLQDNYAIAHWGQTLAIQDCVYRAMAAKHRWAAVLDIDEYILPKSAATPNWPALLQQLAQDNGGRAAAEYSFSGVKMCSGCIQQQQQEQDNVPDACKQPVTVGFHHITWPSAVLCSQPGQQCDYKKTIVDPLAVGQAHVHSTANISPYSLVSGSVIVSQDIAVKLHDRVHDIHKGSITFAARMLPLLQANIGQVAAATAAGMFDQQTHMTELAGLPVWPVQSSDCQVCGSVNTADMNSPALQHNLLLCGLYGEQLRHRISANVAAMIGASTFNGAESWASKDPTIANLYGGHVFAKWAPPEQLVVAVVKK